jgi:ketosteroid isomerase-like protein
MRTRAIFPAAVLLCGCGLRHRTIAPEPVRGPAIDSLFQIDQARGDSVAALGAVDGMLASLAPNVSFLRAGVPAVYGRDAVRTLLGAGPALPVSRTWQPLGGGISYDLHSAYTYGVAARLAPPKPEIRLERYVAYWERAQGRGQPWRIVAYAEIGSPAETGLTIARIDPPELGRVLSKPAAAAVDKVRATDSLFSDLADRTGIAFAFSNNADDYGAIFGSPGLAVGPKAIREFLESQGSASSLSWRPIYSSVAGSLDLAFTIGDYTTTSRGTSGAAIQRFGKYLTVWKREKDGTWKFVIDGGNATPAKPE